MVPVIGRSAAFRLWLAVLCGYLALGATVQALPDLVTRRFDGGALLSATAVGTAFLATACARPFAGLLADAGRARLVVTTGGLLGLVGGLGHLYASDYGLLLLSRLVMGAGEAALFSGALPWVLHGVPQARRGRIAGWFGLSMWTGLAAGPLLATLLSREPNPAGVWYLVIGLAALSSALAASGRHGSTPGRVPAFPRSVRAVVPAGAVLPGIALGLSSYGYGTISALLILYLRHGHIGGDAAGLSLFACGFLVTRALGSPLVDRYGGRLVGACSLVVEALGITLLALANNVVSALVGVVLAGVGVALMYPSTVAITMSRVDGGLPGASIGAATSFWDLGLLVAGPVGGLLATRVGYPAAFFTAVGAAGISCLLIAVWIHERRPGRTEVHAESTSWRSAREQA